MISKKTNLNSGSVYLQAAAIILYVPVIRIKDYMRTGLSTSNVLYYSSRLKVR